MYITGEELIRRIHEAGDRLQHIEDNEKEDSHYYMLSDIVDDMCVHPNRYDYDLTYWLSDDNDK